MKRTLFFGLFLLLAACKEDTPPAAPEVTIPKAPDGVRALAEKSFVRLNWDDASSDETAFVIARVELPQVDAPIDSNALQEIGRATADQETFRDDSALPGKIYGYGVAAENGAGKSIFTVQQGGGVSFASTSTSGCEIAVASDEDRDGDGLLDVIEEEGWTVRVDENGLGETSERLVTGPTTSADGDNDGLCDYEEHILRTDPNVADTDGDGLSDADETRTWGSSPINVDSDADASGNTAFYDGGEVTRYGTSPTLADTDGDGRSDFQEINQSSTNALLADLPKPKLELVGGVDLGLDIKLASGMTEENAVTNAFSRGTETATQRTNSTASSVTSEISAEVSATVGASFPDGVSASVSASGSYTEGYTSETGISFSRESSETAQQSYQQATTRAITKQETIEQGHLAVQLQISNDGARTFNLKNLVLTALAKDPANPASLRSVATLALPESAQDLTLMQGESRGPFRVEATLPANVALSLLANPSGLYFRPASFQLVDRTGANFEFSIGETTSNRTALITIDFDGAREIETYRVATNVARKDGGSVAGIAMKDVLEDILRLDYATAQNSRGVRVLTKVRELEAQRRPSGQGTGRFWAVIAAENATSNVPAAERLLDPSKHFEELILMPRDRVYLAYVADDDGDGLFSREERLYRSSDSSADSDNDGRSDFDEIRNGWIVRSPLPHYANNPLVRSNPALADADGDRLNDAEEERRGTDPNRADTDGDGLEDDTDDDPANGLSPPYLRLFGTVTDDHATDLAVDSNQNVYLLGSSGGDMDGDGLIAFNTSFFTNRFLASYDAQGTKRWAVEFEQIPYARTSPQTQIVVDERDHVFWLEVGYDGVLPGVTNGQPRLFEFDADGTLLQATPLRYPADQGLADRFEPEWFGQLPSGAFLAIGPDGQGPGARVRVMTFDATATITNVHTWNDSEVPWTFHAGISEYGILLTRGCQVYFHSANAAYLRTVDHCGRVPQVARLALARDGGSWIADNREVHRFDTMGQLSWSASTPGSTTSFLYALETDRLERTFLTTHDSGTSWLRGLTRTGATSFDATLADFSANTIHVDRAGNLFLLGSSENGFGGRLPAVGRNDLVLLRNPQLVFGP